MKIYVYTIIILTMISCKTQLKSDKELTNKIESIYKKNKKPVDLSEITDFEWDSYFLVGPYTPIEQIEHSSDLDLDNIQNNGITFSDSIILLVFIKNKKSIKICELKAGVEIGPQKKLVNNH